MPLYYDTTPWLIPEAGAELRNLFYKIGRRIKLDRGSLMQAEALKGDGRSITLLESGLLGQSYTMRSPSKPYTMSLVLPGRIINYFAYLGIDNKNEEVLILRNSTVLTCRLDELKRALEEDGLDGAYHEYCMACIASDYGAFTCMFAFEAEERLAHLFLSLSKSLDCTRTEGCVHIPLQLTYAELSYVMHSNVKTIERIFAKWHKSGVLKSEKEGFLVSEELLEGCGGI